MFDVRSETLPRRVWYCKTYLVLFIVKSNPSPIPAVSVHSSISVSFVISPCLDGPQHYDEKRPLCSCLALV